MATAQDSPDPIWYISTRKAAPAGQVDGDQQEERISYYRRSSDDAWKPADRDEFLKTTDAAVPTAIFIHGNRTGPCEAVRAAWPIYRRMKCDAAGRPFRLVVWSWPAGRVCRRLRADLQTKACYSDTQAYYLARLLADVPRDARVTLVGYSYGARAVTGALHILAGGELAGRQLEDGQSKKDARERTPLRAVLVAAALDAGSLSPGCRNGLATTQVDRILITRNSCDRALKWYPRLYGRGGPEAMGRAGACWCSAPCDNREQTDMIEQIDLTCSVGRSHDWARYICSPALMERLARYTFLEDEPAPAAAIAAAD